MWPAVLLSACSTPSPEPAPALAPAVATPEPAAEAPARPAESRPARDLPPTIDAITFSPPVPKAADTLVATVTTRDAENAPIDLDFEWFVNDAPIVDVASEKLAGRFVKGDKVRVRVTAEDGQNRVTQESEPVVVGNTPPVFEAPARMSKVDGFAFRATDPDGDPLTWRIENAPKGMSISPTGVLSYQGSTDEPGGAYTVAVVVEDGEAWGRYEFPLTVTAGRKGGAPAGTAEK